MSRIHEALQRAQREKQGPASALDDMLLADSLPAWPESTEAEVVDEAVVPSFVGEPGTGPSFVVEQPVARSTRRELSLRALSDIKMSPWKPSAKLLFSGESKD